MHIVHLNWRNNKRWAVYVTILILLFTALVTSLASFPLQGRTSAETGTFGTTFKGNKPERLNFNYKIATVDSAAKAGEITAVTVYLDGKGASRGSGTVAAAVYATTKKSPGTLLGSSEAQTIPAQKAAGWVTFKLKSPVKVVAGGKYWLAIVGGKQSVARIYHGATTKGQVFSRNTSGATPASTFGKATYEKGPLSAYATYTTDSVATPPSVPTVPSGPTTPTLPTQPSADGFAHPGVGLGKTQLDFVKAKIAAGQEPWASAFKKLQNSGTASDGQHFSSLSYTPHPVDVLKCATAGGRAYIAAHPEKPELKEQGCAAQTDDAVAAYTDALQWYYTGNPAYAQKSIQIMNAWSGKLTSIWFDQPRQADGSFIYGNGKLQAAWTGETITRAAEIIRYTYTPAAGQESFNVPRFSSMLTNVILPLTINNWTDCCSNWLLSTTDATMAIGVFTGNHDTFNNGVGDWRGQVPAAIYMASDKPKYSAQAGAPLPPPASNYDRASVTGNTIESRLWNSPTKLVNGLEGETCRDMSHMVMGMEAMAYGAETARLQGIDLWGEQKTRITSALELNAGYLNQKLTGQTVSNWACPKPLNLGGTGYTLGWQVAYNNYAVRGGVSLPQTKALIDRLGMTGPVLHIDYETLTYTGTP